MLCVKNGMVHDAIHEVAYQADILVEDGRIKAIGEHLETEEGVQIVEAEGQGASCVSRFRGSSRAHRAGRLWNRL